MLSQDLIRTILEEREREIAGELRRRALMRERPARRVRAPVRSPEPRP